MSDETFKHRRILMAIWAVALLGCFFLDQPLAQWVHDHHPVDKRQHITHKVLETIKLPGWFPVTLVIAVLLTRFHRRRWVAGAALALSGVAAGALYSVIKWMVGRHRPDHGLSPFKLTPFSKGFPGLWRENALCFPSGHASLAFATAMCLAILLPRYRWLFFAIATCTAVERVVENAHYASDVMAGVGLGVWVGGAVTCWFLRRMPSSPSVGGFDVVFPPPAQKI